MCLSNPLSFFSVVAMPTRQSDWGRVLGSAASSTPVQVKGGSSTRNVNRTGASQTLSDNDCQLSRFTRTVEERLKTPTRSIR